MNCYISVLHFLMRFRIIVVDLQRSLFWANLTEQKQQNTLLQLFRILLKANGYMLSVAFLYELDPSIFNATPFSSD